MTSAKAVEQDIERPSDPEVLFDVLFRRAESSRGAKKDIAAVSRSGIEELRKTGIHHARLGERLAVAGAVAMEDVEEFLRPVA